MKDDNQEAFERAQATIKRQEQQRTQRLIQALKVKWAEENEKSTSFFFNRIKQGQTNSNITELKENGRDLNHRQINDKIHAFYQTLYAPKEVADKGHQWVEALQDMKEIPQHIKDSLEGPITMKEMEHAIFKLMKLNKAPGNDGITTAVYRSFWSSLRQPLMDSLQEATLKGEMSPGQKQSIIRLIKKKRQGPITDKKLATH